MHRHLISLLLFGPLLVSASPEWLRAQVHSGRPAEASAPAPPSGSTRAGAAPIAPGSMPRYTGADVRFMQGMIVHHAQALEMTRLVPERSRRQDVRLLAERMEVSQRDEIALMQRWLRIRGEEVPRPGVSHRHRGGGHALMPGMLAREELARLAEAAGEAFDASFLELMIRHHEGALVMVAELLSSERGGREPEVFRLASDVDADQRMEIARMRGMREALPAGAQTAGIGTNSPDPRIGLGAGLHDAGQAARSMELLANRPRPEGFFDAANLGSLLYANTDIAFGGSHLFLGSFHGVQIYDISEPHRPRLRTTIVCPGGQGDVSVHGHLLFMSVEMPNGRSDCGMQDPFDETPSPERILGVRIFDVSDIDRPEQVAVVQTCRGSHTHTLVPDREDPHHVYIYVSGTAAVRPVSELAGCSGRKPSEDPNTSYFRIEVVRVPLAAPQEARVVGGPRIFADRQTGAVAGLWKGGTHGPGTQWSQETNQCHDITVYPEIGLAAGACAGNGILLDIRDPANPVRVDEVVDPNFAFWHSATFSNDGTKVIFTDEWGGGGSAKCRATDRPEWGANAIFSLADGQLQLASYYKMPAPQTATENCVAHNGSLIPVPGRDIKVQAWYQGGISVFDFTDAANPVEIAYFDRGPLSATDPVFGGHWSAYWYNGHIYGSEIARGLDVLRLTPGEHLSQNEIEAAKLVRLDQFNPQSQPKLTWPASFVVARAYLDQLTRNGGLERRTVARISRDLARAERLRSGAKKRNALVRLAAQLERDLQGAADPDRVRALTAVVGELADPVRR